MGSGSADSALSEAPAKLYDAVGAIWLQLFGEHVHVGYYAQPGDQRRRAWQDAQLDHIDAVLEFAGVKRADKLLDLGSGYGGTAVHIAERLGCRATGVNISPFQVQAANSLAARRGFLPEQVAFVVGDALAPDLPDASFDLVVSVEAAAYMPDKAKFVAQLARLVAPGGTVVLVDFCRAGGPISAATAQRLAAMDRVFATPGNWHSAEEYKKLMGASGLSVVRDANWTERICGFWNVSTFTLLLRRSGHEQSTLQWLTAVIMRILTCAVLVIIGGAEVLRSTLFFLTGHQKCVVQGGLDNGTLEYHVIVASKPVSLQAHASLAADAGASKHA